MLSSARSHGCTNLRIWPLVRFSVSAISVVKHNRERDAAQHNSNPTPAPSSHKYSGYFQTARCWSKQEYSDKNTSVIEHINLSIRNGVLHPAGLASHHIVESDRDALSATQFNNLKESFNEPNNLVVCRRYFRRARQPHDENRRLARSYSELPREHHWFDARRPGNFATCRCLRYQ